MFNDRPSGIIILSILALLGGILAAVMAVQALHLLPAASVNNLVFLTDLIGALIFVGLAPAFAWIAYTFWTITLSDWYSVITISFLNLALIILSGMSLAVSSALMMRGVLWNIAVSAIIVNGCTLLYCLLLDKKRAFGSTRT